MRAYSMDLRERALRDSDAGMMAATVAERYHVTGLTAPGVFEGALDGDRFLAYLEQI